MRANRIKIEAEDIARTPVTSMGIRSDECLEIGWETWLDWDSGD